MFKGIGNKLITIVSNELQYPILPGYSNKGTTKPRCNKISGRKKAAILWK